MPIEEINRSLNCIRLRWHRVLPIHNKKYALVPAENIRGVVYIVRSDQEMEKILSYL